MPKKNLNYPLASSIVLSSNKYKDNKEIKENLMDGGCWLLAQ
jgi:hypothetical protein